MKFADNAVLSGVNAFLPDNNASTGSEENSATVTVYRKYKVNNSILSEVIYTLTAYNTAGSVFNSFTKNTP